MCSNSGQIVTTDPNVVQGGERISILEFLAKCRARREKKKREDSRPKSEKAKSGALHRENNNFG